MCVAFQKFGGMLKSSSCEKTVELHGARLLYHTDRSSRWPLLVLKKRSYVGGGRREGTAPACDHAFVQKMAEAKTSHQYELSRKVLLMVMMGYIPGIYIVGLCKSLISCEWLTTVGIPISW